MSCKQTGYEFWNDVLKSPKFVAAPMVDMSELAYRLLCRRHGSQLCFSPMLHSQQFVQDFLYRQDNFSTCSDDRPLIVQFCANDPTTFVQAASLISRQCDAIDLNLGCPQAIARKGNYGAFLQDDWDLIHSIVQKAANELPVPVTCKMRILPGHFKKSVEYARMLEKAGCSVLTVHGRTREQKGQATGLASWDAIKEIKASLNIPVIANGNILTFEDVEDCLEYTGADAVMSAEALLHNPALFSSKNPPVWDIVEEYLSIAESCKTSLKCIRCHLFKILYLCIHQDDRISQALAEASSLSDFHSICDILKTLPHRESDIKNSNESKSELDLDDMLLNFDLSFDDSSLSVESDPCAVIKENVHNGNKSCDLVTDEKSGSTIAFCCEDSPPVHSSSESDLLEDMTKDKADILYTELPIWLCHSRPRVGDNDKGRGCYSQYFKLKKKSDTELFMSKKKLRRARHHEKVLAAMKMKRKVKKMRRKIKLAEEKQNQPKIENGSDKEKMNKKQQKQLIRDRLINAQGKAPKVCINLGFASTMVEKELNQLSSQLRRLYGSNRHSSSPLHLYFCNLKPDDELYQMCVAKNDGFLTYVVDMTPKEPESIFNLEDIIYLSPDSENVLETVEEDKVYVIGGIVDGTVKKDLSLNHAKCFNVQTARLPIAEYLVKSSTNPGTTVLTVNQVFDILLKYYETKDWVEALSKNVPARKGYCAPHNLKKDKCDADEVNSSEAACHDR